MKKPSTLFSTYFTFSKFVQQISICDHQHPVSTHGTTVSHLTDVCSSASTPNATHSFLERVLKSGLVSGVETMAVQSNAS